MPLDCLNSKSQDGSVWRVVLIERGESLNGVDWPEQPLKEAIPLFEGSLGYFAYEYKGADKHFKFYDHLSEAIRKTIPGGQAMKNMVGDYTNVEYGEFTKEDGSKGKGIIADFNISQNAGWLKTHLKEAFEKGKKALGFSIDAKTQWIEKLKENGRRIKEVLKIGKIDEITVVSEPGAGGRLLRLVQSDNQKLKEAQMLEKLLNWLEQNYKEDYTKLIESFKDDTKEEDKLTAVLKMMDKIKESSVKSKTEKKPIEGFKLEDIVTVANKAVNDALNKQNTDAAKITESRRLLTAKLQESKGIPEIEKTEIQEEFQNKVMTEAEIDLLLKRKQDKFVKLQESKLYFPGQERENIVIKHDEYEKLVNGMTGMLLNEDQEKIPAFKTIHESYRKITGFNGNPAAIGSKIYHEILFSSPPESFIMENDDLNVQDAWRVKLRESRSRMQETNLTTRWAEVYGDSVRRALMKQYDRAELTDWKKIVSDITSAPDFRTNRRQRVGGFGNLSSVSAGGTYQEITFPTDDEVTFAVTKRGNLVNFNMEDMINDDLGILRQIPRKLGVAAAQTLYEFVFDFVKANGTMDYDSVALYHASSHGANLATTALSDAALDDRIFNMRQQTEQDSSKPLGLTPKYLIHPAELERTAFELAQSNVTFTSGRTETVPQWARIRAIEPITVLYWTDANDWYLVADPKKYPTMEIAFLQGRQEPELFIQDQPTIGSVFSADKITYKLRHIYGGDMLDHRPWDGNVVA